VLLPVNTIVSAEPGEVLERLLVEIELAVFDDEDGRLAQGSIDGHVAGEKLIPAPERIARRQAYCPRP